MCWRARLNERSTYWSQSYFIQCFSYPPKSTFSQYYNFSNNNVNNFPYISIWNCTEDLQIFRQFHDLLKKIRQWPGENKNIVLLEPDTELCFIWVKYNKMLTSCSWDNGAKIKSYKIKHLTIEWNDISRLDWL